MSSWPKSGNEQYIELIMEMDAWELLTEVMAYPNYFSDHYYADFAKAMEERYQQLEKERLAAK